MKNEHKKRRSRRRSYSMRNITRMDYVYVRGAQRTTHTLGWWVRFKRSYNSLSLFFSDSKHGGRIAALLKAQAFRDRMEPYFPRESEFQQMLARAREMMAKKRTRALTQAQG